MREYLLGPDKTQQIVIPPSLAKSMHVAGPRLIRDQPAVLWHAHLNYYEACPIILVSSMISNMLVSDKSVSWTFGGPKHLPWTLWDPSSEHFRIRLTRKFKDIIFLSASIENGQQFVYIAIISE